MCAISSLTSTFAILSPDEFLFCLRQCVVNMIHLLVRMFHVTLNSAHTQHKTLLTTVILPNVLFYACFYALSHPTLSHVFGLSVRRVRSFVRPDRSSYHDIS